MTPLDDLRWRTQYAQETGTHVVLTAAEAQAVLDQLDGKTALAEDERPDV